MKNSYLMHALVVSAGSNVQMYVAKRHAALLFLAVFSLITIPPISIFITGGLTRTFAIIAVIACGIAAMAGKLSWDWAIKIVVGIVLIFGSTALVDYVISASSST